MDKKDQAIFEMLLDIYSKIYENKEFYNPKFTKYTLEEVSESLNKYLIKKEKSKEKEKILVVRDEILKIKSEDDLYKFYVENLTYDINEKSGERECLKRINIEELKYLYYIILSTPLKKNTKKIEVLQMIKNYFDSVGRVISMKP